MVRCQHEYWYWIGCVPSLLWVDDNILSLLIFQFSQLTTSSHQWDIHASFNQDCFSSCCCSSLSHPSSGNLSKKQKKKQKPSYLPLVWWWDNTHVLATSESDYCQSTERVIFHSLLLKPALHRPSVFHCEKHIFSPYYFAVPLICVQTHHLSIYLAVCSGEHLSPGSALCVSVFISSLSDLHHGSLTNVFLPSTRDHLLQRAPNNEHQEGHSFHSDDGRDLPLL